jgi:hypothetical protein
MASFDSKYAKCPFFHRFESNRICCEGLEDNNTINLVFEDPKKLNEYKHTYCCDIDHYRWCLICGILNRKYGD